MSKFAEALEHYNVITGNISSGHFGMVRFYNSMIEIHEEIKEALELASKLQDNPYAVTTQEPFQTARMLTGTEVKARWKPVDTKDQTEV